MASYSPRYQHSRPIILVGNLCKNCGKDEWILCPRSSRPGVEYPGSCFRCFAADLVDMPRVDITNRAIRMGSIVGLLKSRGEAASRRRTDVLWRMLNEERDALLEFVEASLEFAFDAADDYHASIAIEGVIIVFEAIEASFDSTTSPSPLPRCLRIIENALMHARASPAVEEGEPYGVQNRSNGSHDIILDRVCMLMRRFIAKIPDGAKLLVWNLPSSMSNLVNLSAARCLSSCLPQAACTNLQVLAALLQAAAELAAEVKKPATVVFAKETTRDLVSFCLKVLSGNVDFRTQRESLGLLYLLASIDELRVQLLDESAGQSNVDGGLNFVDVARRLLTHHEKETKVDILLVLLRTVALELKQQRDWKKVSGLITDEPGMAASRKAYEINVVGNLNSSDKFLEAYIESDVVSCVSRCCLDFSEPALMRLALAFLRRANTLLTDTCELMSALLPPLCALIRPGVARHRRGTEAHKVVCSGLQLLGCLLDKKETFWGKHADVILDMVDTCLSHTGVRSSSVLVDDIEASVPVQLPTGGKPWLIAVPGRDATPEVRFRAEPRIFDVSSVLVIKMAPELDYAVVANLFRVAMDTTNKAFLATTAHDFAVEFALSTTTLIASLGRLLIDMANRERDIFMEVDEDEEADGSVYGTEREEQFEEAISGALFLEIVAFIVRTILPGIQKSMDSEQNMPKCAQVLDRVSRSLPLLFDAAKDRAADVEKNCKVVRSLSADVKLVTRESSAYTMLVHLGWLPLLVRGWKIMSGPDICELQDVLARCCREAVLLSRVSDDSRELNLADALEDALDRGLCNWHLEMRIAMGIDNDDLIHPSQPSAEVSGTIAAAKLLLFYAHEASREFDWKDRRSSTDILKLEELVAVLKTVINGCLFDSDDPVWNSQGFLRVMLFCFAIADCCTAQPFNRSKRAFNDKDRNWVLYKTSQGLSRDVFTEQLYTHHAALLIWTFTQQESLSRAMAVLKLWIDFQVKYRSHDEEELGGIWFPPEVFRLPFFIDALAKCFAIETDFEKAKKLVASFAKDSSSKQLLLDNSETMAIQALVNLKKQITASRGLGELVMSDRGLSAIRHLDLILSLVIEGLTVKTDSMKDQTALGANSSRTISSQQVASLKSASQQVPSKNDSSSDIQHPFGQFSQFVRKRKEPQQADPSQRTTGKPNKPDRNEKRWRIAHRLAEFLIEPAFEELKSFIYSRPAKKDETSEANPAPQSLALVWLLDRVFSLLTSLLNAFGISGGASHGEEKRMKESLFAAVASQPLLLVYAQIVNWDPKVVAAHKLSRLLMPLKSKAARLLAGVLQANPLYHPQVADAKKKIVPAKIRKKSLLETIITLTRNFPEDGSPDAFLRLLGALLREKVLSRGDEAEPRQVFATLVAEGGLPIAGPETGARSKTIPRNQEAVLTSSEILRLVWRLQAFVLSGVGSSECLVDVLVYWKQVDKAACRRYILSIECGMFMVASLKNGKIDENSWKLWEEFLKAYQPAVVGLQPRQFAGRSMTLGIEPDMYFGEFVRGLQRRIQSFRKQKSNAEGTSSVLQTCVEEISKLMRTSSYIQRYLRTRPGKAGPVGRVPASLSWK